MLNELKNFIARVMRVPPEPHDPMGDVQSLRVFRASRQYLYYRYLSWAGGQLVVLIFAGGLLVSMTVGLWNDRTVERWIPFTIGVAGASLYLLQLIISFFMVWLDYEMRWYKITDRSLRIRYGIRRVREHTVTFANIQNISVTQGPLQRLFGIAEVQVDTAGGGGAKGGSNAGLGFHGGLIGLAIQAQAQQQMLNLHQAVFRGVDNAEEIRDLMMVRLRRVRDAGLGETRETADPSPSPTASAAPSFSGANWSADAVTLLAALRQEAAALRQAAENTVR
jgi:membrane protein YdbS with pleckstrin-like domain